MKALLFAMLTGFFTTLVAIADNDGENGLSAVVNGILIAKARCDKNPVDPERKEIFNSWSFALSRDDAETGRLGVVSLWMKSKRSLVELVWWRQKDPEVRKCVLLLFYSLSKVELDSFPDFEDYAKRFELKESEERKKEIELVKGLVETGRPLLQKAFEERPPQDR